MNHSMAQQQQAVPTLELPAWKTAVNWMAAILTSLLFIAAGLWKITDPIAAAVRLAQARIPESLSLAAALLLGIAETVAAVLVLVPRFRKWGAWLGAALLVAFMIYIGANYSTLHGAECSCFPWIKRAVGPGFFVGDAAVRCDGGVLGGPVAKQAQRYPGGLRGDGIRDGFLRRIGGEDARHESA